MNNFLQFYRENEISPVSQDIRDLRRHAHRREALYRVLGLPKSMFRDKVVLEVGPGSGFNSIVTATFGPTRYDLVEPNRAGYDKLTSWFDREKEESSVRCFNLRLEEMPADLLYDIVLCEGLIPGLSQGELFVAALAKKVRPGGVLVVTCADSVSTFFETVRRYLARLLVSGIAAPDSKVEAKNAIPLLAATFGSHLQTLGGMSRPIDDWIWDNLLNPATASLAASLEFSIDTCLNVLGGEFYCYGSSPVFLEDWTWYKELPSSPRHFNEPFRRSFIEKRHNLLHYQETSRQGGGVSAELYAACRKFSERVESLPALLARNWSAREIACDVAQIALVGQLACSCSLPRATKAISECVALLAAGSLPSVEAIERMEEFRQAFGRGQQYLSLIRA